jgi:hypothetical protein
MLGCLFIVPSLFDRCAVVDVVAAVVLVVLVVVVVVVVVVGWLIAL